MAFLCCVNCFILTCLSGFIWMRTQVISWAAVVGQIRRSEKFSSCTSPLLWFTALRHKICLRKLTWFSFWFGETVFYSRILLFEVIYPCLFFHSVKRFAVSEALPSNSSALSHIRLSPLQILSVRVFGWKLLVVRLYFDQWLFDGWSYVNLHLSLWFFISRKLISLFAVFQR